MPKRASLKIKIYVIVKPIASMPCLESKTGDHMKLYSHKNHSSVYDYIYNTQN